jgi:alpha-galactosidase/6-phospho-beta-glucosidase family protein
MSLMSNRFILSNQVICVKSCHSCQIMSFMSNHVIHVKSCHSCQIMSFMSNHFIYVKSCHCNRVRDRYEDKVERTLAQTTHSSRCGCQLCKQHERSNMWYQRELIKNRYSTTAYAGLTARQDLPWFIVFHSDVMWPYYIWRQRSVLRPRRKQNMPRKPLAATTTIKLPLCNESTMLRSTPPGCTTQVA